MRTLHYVLFSISLVVISFSLMAWDSPIGWSIAIWSLGFYQLINHILEGRRRKKEAEEVDRKIITAMKIVTDAMGNLAKNTQLVVADLNKQASKIASHEKRLTHITITEERLRRTARRDEVVNTQLTNRAERSKRASDKAAEKEEKKSKE